MKELDCYVGIKQTLYTHPRESGDLAGKGNRAPIVQLH